MIDTARLRTAAQGLRNKFKTKHPISHGEYISDEGNNVHKVYMLDPEGNRSTETEIRGRVKAWAGVIVRIGIDRERWGPDEQVILGVDEGGYGSGAAPSLLENHGTTHGFNQPDETANLHSFQIYPFRGEPQATADKTVLVRTGIYRAGGSYRSIPANITEDLTSQIGALSSGEKQFITLSGKADQTVTATAGVVRANPQATDIPDAPAGEAPICAVLIYFGQTTITRSDLFYDLRYIPGPLGGSGGGGSGDALWGKVLDVATSGGQYSVIQMAENALTSGDVAWVMPGTYAENLWWDSDGPLIAATGAKNAGNVILSGADDTGPMVYWDASRTIKGVLFQRTLSGGSGEYVCINSTVSTVTGNLVDCHIDINDGGGGRALTAVKIGAASGETVKLVSCDIDLTGAGTKIAVELHGETVQIELSELGADITSNSATDLVLVDTYVGGDVTGTAGGTLVLRGQCTITGAVTGWDSVRGSWADASGNCWTATSSGGSFVWGASAVAAVSQEILPDDSYDVTAALWINFVVKQNTSSDVSGSGLALEPGATSDIFDDGTDVLTLTVAAGGAVSVVRSAGTATFEVSIQGTYI